MYSLIVLFIASHVSFAALGREVATPVEGDLKAGVIHHTIFDALKLASGVYFSRLEYPPKADPPPADGTNN